MRSSYGQASRESSASSNSSFLWNQLVSGKAVALGLDACRRPLVRLKEQALNAAFRLSLDRSVADAPTLQGTICAERNGITVLLDQLSSTGAVLPGDIARATCKFQKPGEQREPTREERLAILTAVCQIWDEVPLVEVLPLTLCAPHVEVRCCARGPLCSVSVELLTASLPLRLVPLHPVPVLRSGVQDGPFGNTPDFGFVVRCVDRLCFLFKHQLDNSDLPLVGVWVSGVDSIQHPFLWLVCAQFLTNDRLFSRPSEVFVVSLLTGADTLFYNCLCPPGIPRVQLQLWQGQASTSIARVPSASTRTLAVPLEPVVSGRASEDMLWAHEQLSSLPPSAGRQELPSQELCFPSQPVSVTPTVPELSDLSVAPSYLAASAGDAPPPSAAAELSLPEAPERGRLCRLSENSPKTSSIPPGTGCQQNDRIPRAHSTSWDTEAVFELIRRQDEQLRELRLQLEQVLRRQAQDDQALQTGRDAWTQTSKPGLCSKGSQTSGQACDQACDQTLRQGSPREPYTLFFPEKHTPGAGRSRDQATGRSPLLPDRPMPGVVPAPLQASPKAVQARLEGTQTLIVPRLEYQSLQLASGGEVPPGSPQGDVSVATHNYLHQYGLLPRGGDDVDHPILDISALKKLPKLL